MDTKTLKDKKISIRKLAPSDINHPEKFQKFVNSLVAEDVMILINTKKSKKEEQDWLKGRISEVQKHKTVYLIAESKDNGEIVGTCHLGLLRERMNHIGEFGIGIKQNFRGIGLGKHLMETIIKIAKTDLKPIPKIIELGVYEGNNPAIALYKKMGFKIVAKIPNSVQYKGKLTTKIIMHLEI